MSALPGGSSLFPRVGVASLIYPLLALRGIRVRCSQGEGRRMMMSVATEFDARAFRSALGTFTTGVTIITARAEDGTRVGLTANSFNSVSLEPPMVLWSLAKNSRSLPVFETADFWTVHILSCEQDDLSNRFASRSDDKFGGLDLDEGIGGVPMLQDCTARFQCKASFKYEGGDHIIFVGEVVEFDRSEKLPLVFHGGKYALATAKGGDVSLSGSGRATGPDSSFGEDFLGYLLGRAHYQVYNKLRVQLGRHGLSDVAFFALSVLSVRDGRRMEEVNDLISYTGLKVTREVLQDLRRRELVQTGADGDPLYLTENARGVVLKLVAAAKAMEADLLGELGLAEGVALKNLLKKLILQSDPGVPDLWAGSEWDDS